MLLKSGFTVGCKLGKGFDLDKDLPKLMTALSEADRLLDLAVHQEPKVSQEVPCLQC